MVEDGLVRRVYPDRIEEAWIFFGKQVAWKRTIYENGLVKMGETHDNEGLFKDNVWVINEDGSIERPGFIDDKGY